MSGRAKGLVQAQLAFKAVTIGRALGHQHLFRRQQLERDETHPSNDDSTAKSPSRDDKKDQSLDQRRGSEVKGSSTNNPPKPPRSPSTLPPIRRIHLPTKTGDIFDSAPPKTLFIHACNTVGTWDNGIAKVLRKQYPHAFVVYHGHCSRSLPVNLIGTSLLIAPRADDARQHYVGCLFVTSKGHRRSRDKPKPYETMQATGRAMLDLLRRVVRDGSVGEMRMPRIVSTYGVTWHDTYSTIRELELREKEVIGNRRGVTITVYSLA